MAWNPPLQHSHACAPVVQHSPSLQTASAQAFNDALAVKTRPNVAHSVNVEHIRADGSGSQEATQMKCNRKPTSESGECNEKKKGGGSDKTTTNEKHVRYQKYNTEPHCTGWNCIKRQLRRRCGLSLVDITPCRIFQLEPNCRKGLNFQMHHYSILALKIRMKRKIE